MSGPSHTPVTEHRHRKRRTKHKGLKAVPKVVWIAIGICLVVVLSIPIASYQGWRWKQAVSGNNAAHEGARGAVVSDAVMDTACNCIRGNIANGSNQAFNEVHLLFQLDTADKQDLGTVVAVVSHLQPHTNLKFATDSIPRGVGKFELKEIKVMQ